jgi:hypothetical protein
MKLVSRIYDGPFPEVDLPMREPLEDGRIVVKVKRGELCEEIPAELAETLDQQGDWLLPDGSVPEAAKPREERVFTKAELKAIAEENEIEVPAKATKAEIEDLIAQHARDAEGDGVQIPGEPGDQASGDSDASTSADSGE